MVNWTQQDDDALLVQYDARLATGFVGHDAFELPSGRTLTPAQARRRCSRSKASCAKSRYESDPEGDETSPLVEPTRGRRPKWSPEDDAAFVVQYDARRAAGCAWADDFALPSGRTLTSAQAQNRHSYLKASCAKRDRASAVANDLEEDANPPVAEPTRGRRPKWSQEDDAALVVQYDALRAAGCAWAEDFVLPSGRTLTPAQVHHRRSRLKGSCAKRRRVVESDSESDAAPPAAATRTVRSTPMRQRSDAAGVEYAPTPTDLRAITTDLNASSAARNEARKAIMKHQHARLYRVRTAETQNQKSEVRARESNAVPGPLSLPHSVLRGFVRGLVAQQAFANFHNPTDLMQLRSLVRSLTSNLVGNCTPSRHRHAASAFFRETEIFSSAEYQRRLGAPRPPHRARPHTHQREIFSSLVAAVGVYVHAVLDNDSVGRATRNYIRAVKRFVELIKPPATVQAAASDHRLAVIGFATAVGFFAAALVSDPLREKRAGKKRRRAAVVTSPGVERTFRIRRPPPEPRPWSSLIKKHMIHRLLKCCANCAWAGTVYDQQQAEADEIRRRSNVQAAQTDIIAAIRT